MRLVTRCRTREAAPCPFHEGASSLPWSAWPVGAGDVPLARVWRSDNRGRERAWLGLATATSSLSPHVAERRRGREEEKRKEEKSGVSLLSAVSSPKGTDATMRAPPSWPWLTRMTPQGPPLSAVAWRAGLQPADWGAHRSVHSTCRPVPGTGNPGGTVPTLLERGKRAVSESAHKPGSERGTDGGTDHMSGGKGRGERWGGRGPSEGGAFRMGHKG